MNTIEFNDNIRVAKRKWGNDFFKIEFNKPHPKDEYSIRVRPFIVAIAHYCVPGRIASYDFELIRGDIGIMERVRFCSESQLSLEKALRQLHQDLDKPQVIYMLVKCCGVMSYAYRMKELLSVIAPKSKSYRAILKSINAHIALGNIKKLNERATS